MFGGTTNENLHVLQVVLAASSVGDRDDGGEGLTRVITHPAGVGAPPQACHCCLQTRCLKIKLRRVLSEEELPPAPAPGGLGAGPGAGVHLLCGTALWGGALTPRGRDLSPRAEEARTALF